MRLPGRVHKEGSFWAVEVPLLGVFTQGRTKRDALLMLADAIETLTNESRFRLQIYAGKGGHLEVGSNSPTSLVALLLRRQRQLQGLSLAEVSQRLGVRSRNAYARYEQGRAAPTIEKLDQLLKAVNPTSDFVLAKCAA